MNRLFGGLFFVLLDYKVTLGRAVFELLPDFVGYYLLMKGMETLAVESRSFNRGRHWAFAMTLVSGVLYLADLTDPDTLTQVWLWAAELAALIVMLLMIRCILTGLVRMGRTETETVKPFRLILAVLLPLCHLLSWIPMVGTVCRWAGILASVLFLAAFYKEIKKSAG